MGEDSSEVKLTVLPDPRTDIPQARRQAKLEALERANGWAALSREAQDRLEEALQGMEEVLDRLGEGDENPELEETGELLKNRIQELLEQLFTGPACQGICGGNPVAAPIRAPISRLGSSLDAPSPTDLLAMDQAQSALGLPLRRRHRCLPDNAPGRGFHHISGEGTAGRRAVRSLGWRKE